jgi:hypothetical protein
MSQRTRSRASSANNDANGEDGGATVATAEAPERESRETRDGKNEGFHNLADLKEMSISKLTQIAKSMMCPAQPGCVSRNSSSKFSPPRRKRAA